MEKCEHAVKEMTFQKLKVTKLEISLFGISDGKILDKYRR